MKKWRCTVCGYIHSGEFPPEKCPNCGAPREKFIEVAVDFDELHINYGQKLSYGDKVEINQFFGDFEAIAPFVYNLPVGARVPLHKHPKNDELFFVLKGKIKFKIGEKELVAVKGDVVRGKMNIPHTFQNIGDEAAAFLSIKGPKPISVEKLE